MLDQVGSRVGAEKLVEARPYAHARIEQSKRFPTVCAICQGDVIWTSSMPLRGGRGRQQLHDEDAAKSGAQ